MADDDIIEEEINLDNVVNERTYKKAMDVIKGVKKTTKELKKATKELKEVTSADKLTGSGSMSFGAFGDPDQQALPKGKTEQPIGLVEGLTGGGAHDISRGNKWKQMVEDIERLKAERELAEQERKANEFRSMENKTENELQGMQLRSIQAQMAGIRAQAQVGLGMAGKGLGIMKNPLGSMQNMLMGVAGKFFPVMMAITVATTVYSMVVAQFGDGGLFDVRKLVTDQVKEYFDLEFVNQVNRGEVFFGFGAEAVSQGIGTSGSNTRDKSYAHLTDRPQFQGL